MNTANITYQGKLRTESTHLKSGEKIITDAPTDNHGKGEAFSPTDLIASALVSCMITIIGIQADKKSLSIGEVTGTVEKVMADNPRRIGQLIISLTFSGHNLSSSERSLVQNAALTCPVAHSLHPDLNQLVKFSFD